MSCCSEHHEEHRVGGKRFTCPMHPEVRSDTPGRCPKCGMDLVKEESEGEGEEELKKPHDHEHHDHAAHDHHAMMSGPGAARDFLRRFAIVTVLLIPLLATSEPALRLLRIPDFSFRASLQFGIATAIFLFALVFFEHAKHEIKARKIGMMTLVSVAVGAGYLFSAASNFFPALKAEFYLEISTLIWVLLFGHYLEARSSAAAGDALQEVAKLLPKEAHLLTDEGTKDVELAMLKENDTVLVKPGEKVPADGKIIKGQANFNEAHLSGESKPVEKKADDRVVAGAICLDGSVEVKLERVGENSTIGQIQKLIAKAQQTKPSAQRLADRISGILTLAALAVAAATVLVWSLVMGQSLVFAVTLAITVLVIACPHALGLAIPTVSTIATQLAVKNGVFLKDLAKLEVVKDIDYVVFDKTGTLTEGKFGVTEIVVLGEKETQNGALTKKQKDLLTVAASLEAHSTHVIGLSILSFAKQQNRTPKAVEKFKNLAGKGIEGRVDRKTFAVGNRLLMEERGALTKEARVIYDKLSQEGKTVVFLSEGKTVSGLIALSDRIKPESQTAVEALHRIGVKVAMLTGDSQEVAKDIAGQLSIDTYFAQVLPDKKYEHIKTLQDRGNKVMMVGDGVNDAPALKQADVGVAIGAGTDVAVEAGDIVLTRNNPQDILSIIVLSRKVFRKMVENLVWALGYNVFAIPAAAGLFIPLGFRLNPKIGAIAMSLSSVIVVANAMTLRKAKLQA